MRRVFILSILFIFSVSSISWALERYDFMSATAETTAPISSYLEFGIVSGTINFTTHTGRVLASSGPVVLRLNTNNFANESQANVNGKATIAVYTKNNDYVAGINASGMVGLTYNRLAFLSGTATSNEAIDWRVAFKCWTANFGSGGGTTPPSISNNSFWQGVDLNGNGNYGDAGDSEPLWSSVIDCNDPEALSGGTTDNFKLRALYSLDDRRAGLHFPERAIHVSSLPVYFAADFTEAALHPQVYKTKVRFVYVVQ
jgi:hypothetical protein